MMRILLGYLAIFSTKSFSFSQKRVTFAAELNRKCLYADEK